MKGIKSDTFGWLGIIFYFVGFFGVLIGGFYLVNSFHYPHQEVLSPIFFFMILILYGYLLVQFIVYHAMHSKTVNGAYVMVDKQGKIIKEGIEHEDYVLHKIENHFNQKDTASFDVKEVRTKNGEIRRDEWFVNYTIDFEKIEEIRKNKPVFSQEWIEFKLSILTEEFLTKFVPTKTSSQLDGSEFPFVRDLLMKKLESELKQYGIGIEDAYFKKTT